MGKQSTGPDNSTTCTYYNWVTIKLTLQTNPLPDEFNILWVQEYIDFLCPTELITSSETQHHRQSDCLVCWPVAAGGYV